MTVFDDALDDLVAKLAAAGLPATRDPAANPPMVLVDLVARLTAFTLGAWSGEVEIKAIAPPPGDLAASRALHGYLETTLRTLGPPRSAFASTVLNGAGKEAPAYVVTYPVEFSNPDC